jgi:hypothetical protein
MEKTQRLQQMFLGKVVIHLQETETRSMSITCTSINSKWIKDLNIRSETLKLVQEGAGNTVELIGIGKDCLNRTPAAQQLRERMDKWDFIKLKSFCTTKEMVCNLKSPPTEWEKIFASYTSDKGLITRIYRELKKIKKIGKSQKQLNKLREDFNKYQSETKEIIKKRSMK